MQGRAVWITSAWAILLAAPLSGFSQRPASPTAPAQTTPAASPSASSTATPAPIPPTLLPTPIAVVSTEGLKLSGAVDLGQGKAVIAFGGSVTAGGKASTITLPHRGNMRICPMTKVNLTADSSVASSLRPGESPGLMMALDQGALEANFQTGENSDVILTPDFRIVISAPGNAEVQVRLGDKGDTCVDNRGDNAPYVTVNSVFDGGVYRVQPNQRVMFQHGSLHEVVDNEKESCGCPPETLKVADNEFPVAQSEGMVSLKPPPPNAVKKGVVEAQATAGLSYDGAKGGQVQAKVATAPMVAAPEPPKPAKEKKPGFFHSIGRFFTRLFAG
jgi:hypothetical protein